MGSQHSQVLEGVPRGFFAELVATRIGWEPGAEGTARFRLGKRKGGAPLPDCLRATVGNRSSPTSLKQQMRTKSWPRSGV